MVEPNVRGAPGSGMADHWTRPDSKLSDMAALRKLEASLQLELAESPPVARVPALVSRNLPVRLQASQHIAVRELAPRELTVEQLLGCDYGLMRWLHWWFRFRK